MTTVVGGLGLADVTARIVVRTTQLVTFMLVKDDWDKVTTFKLGRYELIYERVCQKYRHIRPTTTVASCGPPKWDVTAVPMHGNSPTPTHMV